MLMKYCEKCGSAMPDDSVFCNKCGRKVKIIDYSVSSTGWDSANTSNVPESKKSGCSIKSCGVIFIGFIIFCVVVGSCISNGIKEGKYTTKSSSSSTSSKAESSQESSETEMEFKNSCLTTLTYEQVARHPKDYSGKRAAFYGIVQQVIHENGNDIALKVCIPDGKSQLEAIDDYFWVEYKKPSDKARILVDDRINMYGYLRNTTEARLLVNDQSVTVPKFEAKYIDILNYGG